jgi:hypothetical protein
MNMDFDNGTVKTLVGGVVAVHLVDSIIKK